MPYEIRRHRWGLYFAVENVGRNLPTRHTKDGVDVSLLKDIRPVSIESIKLFVTIHGMIADVTCQATFRNIEEEHIDGFFLFPVEEAAAFYHFEATIRGTKVVAATREKGEHWEYNLLDQLDGEGILLEESSREMFTCHLGVVAPDEVVETMFQFTLEMDVSQEGDVQFLFPSFVPREFQARYMEFAYGQMEQQSYSVDDYSFDFYFQANIASNYRIKDVVSREILEIEYLDQQKHNAKLMLAGSYLPNRDFAFVIRYVDLESPHLLIQRGMDACPYDHVVMKSACAYYTLFHRLNKAHVKALKGEFIICVDKSGPMRGAKSQLSREALLYFIKGLPQGCYFNIVAFSSTETPLFKSSRIYNQYNCMKAIKFQMKMRADMSSSPNILSLLQYVYSQPIIAGHPKQVFIMTEGNVTNIAECIEYVQQREELARVFTIGIGDTAQRPLISGMARATNAKSQFIKLQDKPYTKILDCLKHALQPGLTNLELEFDTPAGVSCLTIPPTIPPIVFAEEKLSVFVLIRGTPDDPSDTECSITLKGNLGRDEPYSHTLNFDLRDQMNNENYPIHRLALRTEIADLEKLIVSALGADDVLENEYHIIQASLAGNIASRFTPMIGVDVHTGAEVEGYPIIKIRPEDNPYRINSSGMDMYMPGTGSVYKSVSRLTLNRGGMTPSTFVKGIFEQPNQGQPARQPGTSMADSRMYDFDDEIGTAEDLIYSRPTQKAALADIDSDMALSEVYMGVKNKNEWEEFKQSLKDPEGLVRSQENDGYWLLNKNTAYAFGSTITDVKKDNPLKNDIIWTTILVINWFYTNFPHRRSEWKEAEDWARSWLYQQDLEGYSLDELLELAAELKHLDGHNLFKPQKTAERQISTISEEDPTEKIPEPVQYIRQDSISMIPENIDYMGEDEYVRDEVGDIYSHYMEGVKQHTDKKGNPPRGRGRPKQLRDSRYPLHHARQVDHTEENGERQSIVASHRTPLPYYSSQNTNPNTSHSTGGIAQPQSRHQNIINQSAHLPNQPSQNSNHTVPLNDSEKITTSSHPPHEHQYQQKDSASNQAAVVTADARPYQPNALVSTTAGQTDEFHRSQLSKHHYLTPPAGQLVASPRTPQSDLGVVSMTQRGRIVRTDSIDPESGEVIMREKEKPIIRPRSTTPRDTEPSVKYPQVNPETANYSPPVNTETTNFLPDKKEANRPDMTVNVTYGAQSTQRPNELRLPQSISQDMINTRDTKNYTNTYNQGIPSYNTSDNYTSWRPTPSERGYLISPSEQISTLPTSRSLPSLHNGTSQQNDASHPKGTTVTRRASHKPRSIRERLSNIKDNLLFIAELKHQRKYGYLNRSASTRSASGVRRDLDEVDESDRLIDHPERSVDRKPVDVKKSTTSLVSQTSERSKPDFYFKRTGSGSTLKSGYQADQSVYSDATSCRQSSNQTSSLLRVESNRSEIRTRQTEL